MREEQAADFGLIEHDRKREVWSTKKAQAALASCAARPQFVSAMLTGNT
jgi:hypothetical protein